MVFPPIHPFQGLEGEEEEEFLADFISYLVGVDPEDPVDDLEAIRYEKINTGDTVVNLRPESNITTIKSLEKVDGSDYVFPNKDVIVVIRMSRRTSVAMTVVIRASIIADTADGDILKTQAIRADGGFFTFRFTGNKNGKFLTLVETASGVLNVTTAFVIEPA